MSEPRWANEANSHGPLPSQARLASWYGLMVLAAVGAFFAIDHWGSRLVAPPTVAAAPSNATVPAESHTLSYVLAALLAVLVTGRLLGRLFRYVGQPPVIGEVVAGILLGPSLLGWFWPPASQVIMPVTIAPQLSLIAQFGVVLYMFLVGLELNLDDLRRRAGAAIAISHASILVPFVFGAALALYLYPRFADSKASFTSFALFLGVAMSITAFPVLARILTDQKLQHTPLGVLALACAATDDVTAWCLLALAVGVVQAKVGGALVVIAVTALYLATMLLLVRPVARRLLAPLEESGITSSVLAAVFAALLLSSLTTEWIGIHAIFGAFLLGAVIPHDSAVARLLPQKLEDFVTVLLLPAFFAFTGMRTQIGLVSGAQQWFACALIILVATLGKFGGSYFPARWNGIGRSESAALAILMNTRGLMELIVLNIGLDLGILSPTLFAMMVLMALATTMATSPLLKLVWRPPCADSADAAPPSPGEAGGRRAP